MPRLQQLFVSLENIINTYCNILLKDEPVLVERTNNEDVSYSNIPMDERINLATASNIRGPLMHYILYGFEQLKPLMEVPVILDRNASLILQNKLVQLIVDLKRLIETSQSTAINISYDNKTVPIYGCIRDGFFSRGLSKSGIMVQDMLFAKLNLPVNAQENQIEQFIVDALNEHQCELLKRENEQVRAVNYSLTKDLQNTKELLVAKDRQETLKQKRRLIQPPVYQSGTRNWLSIFNPPDHWSNDSEDLKRDIFFGHDW